MGLFLCLFPELRSNEANKHTKHSSECRSSLSREHIHCLFLTRQENEGPHTSVLFLTRPDRIVQMMEIKWSCDRFISTMGFPLLVRRHFSFEIEYANIVYSINMQIFVMESTQLVHCKSYLFIKWYFPAEPNPYWIRAYPDMRCRCAESCHLPWSRMVRVSLNEGLDSL